MSLKFTKMHGLGNDFIVIDAINQPFHLNEKQIANLANRYTGIGFDQCLVLEKPHTPHVDFFYRIFNANGQEVGQCGNGARCLMRFIHYYGLSSKKTLQVATHTTQMQLQLNSDDSVTVDFEAPQWEPSSIPFRAATEKTDAYALSLPNGSLQHIHAVSVGNPHAVSVLHDNHPIDINALGKMVSEHPDFPEQCNASFMEIIDNSHIRLRVYERGCGETSACGSAAVAAGAVGRKFYNLGPRIHVALNGGELVVDWPAQEGSIQLTGPATFVYEGKLFPCALLY